MDDADRYRCRRIYLKQSDNQAYQAEAACGALANIEGILLAAPFDQHCIHIIYSLDKLSFEIVIELLNELEFETDKSLLLSLRNTIFCFLEDNARDNMHIDVTEFQQDDNEGHDAPPQLDDEKYWDDYH
ncbi:MAG: hypothetical protein LJE92_09245 [Gammaproteobacteria bacterium]|jgi:hypothetical protein|nr:hypothetical protein [Gammaproteobacteria bacterium]